MSQPTVVQSLMSAHIPPDLLTGPANQFVCVCFCTCYILVEQNGMGVENVKSTTSAHTPRTKATQICHTKGPKTDLQSQLLSLLNINNSKSLQTKPETKTPGRHKLKL